MDLEDLDPRFLMTFPAVVVDNKDPDGLSRVRVRVDGIFEPYTDWAVPNGLWGGSKQRGQYGCPDIGADVTLGFHMADSQRPWYSGGYWGDGEGSTAHAGLSPEDAAKMRAIETEKFLITFDDKTGTMVLKEKAGGAFIRITNNKVEVGGVASEKAMLGNAWKAQSDAELDAIQLITVVTAVGTSSVPVNAAAFAAIKAQNPTVLSGVVFVK